MKDDQIEEAAEELTIDSRFEILENEIRLIKLSIDSINKRVGRLSDSNILHHGVYR